LKKKGHLGDIWKIHIPDIFTPPNVFILTNGYIILFIFVGLCIIISFSILLFFFLFFITSYFEKKHNNLNQINNDYEDIDDEEKLKFSKIRSNDFDE
jgi:hypothetical protein